MAEKTLQERLREYGFDDRYRVRLYLEAADELDRLTARCGLLEVAMAKRVRELWTREEWYMGADCALRDDNDRLTAQLKEAREALIAILPFIPKSSAKEGGALAYSENVKAADKVRAALAATEPKP